LPSGLHELDLATLGLVASDPYVLAARTSIGKTTLMMQVAHHAATQSGPVLFVSCEMRPDLLFDRTLAATADVSVNRLARRSLKALELTVSRRAYSSWVRRPCTCSDDTFRTP